ncbi:hypothetical protein Murru_1327 [Allomuricauda ruestringensis DSM 13258]|uniref:Uncharacterized protein n=1 Tax=Allomuricauda ruestringensis (strain DSM 13258 / CIP 107369 / LMG 19739 / B1) TaxID=886377 RepID=G2PPB7_ALLRU|nr:hypothetical protein Murru_1327 [Allomuricauda ruestringensis DSM 13258]
MHNGLDQYLVPKLYIEERGLKSIEIRHSEFISESHHIDKQIIMRT